MAAELSDTNYQIVYNNVNYEVWGEDACIFFVVVFYMNGGFLYFDQKRYCVRVGEGWKHAETKAFGAADLSAHICSFFTSSKEVKIAWMKTK